MGPLLLHVDIFKSGISYSGYDAHVTSSGWPKLCSPYVVLDEN